MITSTLSETKEVIQCRPAEALSQLSYICESDFNRMGLKLFFCAVLVIGYCDASTKEWLPNVNYDNPDNWNVKRLPCANDRVMLTGPENSVVSVFLQSNSTMREIILPMDGVVTMQSDMVLSFSDANEDPSCPGEDVEFIRSNAKDWFDPDNWKDSESAPLLETERVPCSYDDVVFPRDSRYYVQLDMDTSVTSMIFAGQMSSRHFYQALMVGGSLPWISGRAPSVAIRGCLDITGCPCGNDGQIKNRICQNTQCYEPICKSAIIPVDGCCQMCGCALTMLYDKDKFNLEQFKNTINGNYGNKDSYREVKMSTSKTSEDKIQFVATDDHDGQKAGELCIALQKDIVENMARYGITNVTSTASGPGTDKQTGSIPLETGMIAGIVVAVLVVLALIMVIALMYRRGHCGRWPKNKPLGMEMELGSAEFINHPTDPAAVLRGFDNPMYDTPPHSNGAEIATKHNPIYSSAGVLDEEYDGTLRGFSNPVDIETAFATSLDDDDMDLRLKKPIDDSTA
ncbi:protein amnionless-like [Ptychodera flava]|uniref:protein amnionless-like n=1 Tax=Ptychodera flava TaxID=63121 RepID=UPI003969D80B